MKIVKKRKENKCPCGRVIYRDLRACFICAREARIRYEERREPVALKKGA